ncbi:multiple PDZ domain protein isoform X2 [Papilio machaon]|uniref:multiple PDZ domain protein isoform X2 n=1 Tax=Papilio machaon TaxID=76193 RepID=UPI001E665816|nr:multiple PDZ domain protein isoform X2 [Papilio machaon]
MGSNISQHSSKGLKGRRARSSGDLCNGDSKSQTESSVCGSVVGEVMGWNRSLPNHLDGNRHLADYSRVNNNYGELGTYNRCQKGGRGLRYRVSKSGSDAEPVWKLQDSQFDQGYGSERSPEEEYVAPLPLAPLAAAASLEEYEAELRNLYPFITEDNTFTVVVEKDGRGLGMSVCGGAGLVRIRRLYPPQPAWRTGRLAPRDLLLAANGVPLAGLSTYEALEVLRTAATRVELRVCRPPSDALESLTPPDPPTPPVRTPHPPHLPPLDPLNCHPLHARLSQTTSSATTSSSEGRGRREASPEPDRRDLHLPDLDKPLPVYDIQYGEFDIVITKVNGSLGFTLRKEDHSALGHYVRALVREPALSDGRIQPGDRIVAVNDTPMSNMSHTEAVSFLRACGADVRLRLYRDHAATPLSPVSPKDDGPTDSDPPLNRPKPPLRPEAVSMLCDLAARRLTPDATDGARSPCLSPRKFRKLTKDNNHYEQPTVPPHGYELNNLDNDTLDAPNVYQEDIRARYTEAVFPADSDEPVSMPVELSSDEARFKHSNPAYQSAVLTSGSETASDGHKDDGNGLKKWKGVALSPDNERKMLPETQLKQKDVDIAQKENVKPVPPQENVNNEPTIVTVELNRGWNSRLGFSVQSHPESGQSYISAVYSDSVAARDGRLRPGDVILQVNDENVTSMKTPEVIDLLRILRGSICITVLRPPNSK